MRSNPVLFPPYFPSDETYPYPSNRILFGNAGTTGNYINPYADMVKGYKTYNASTVLAQFELKQNLDFILKGLKIRAMYNETRNIYSDVNRSYRPFYYSVGSYNKYSNTYMLSELNQTTGTDYLDYSEELNS